MKRIFLLLALILSAITVGCGETKEEGRLYTRDDIFIDCIKIGYPEGFTSKMIIIEDDEALKSAVIEFPKLESMPKFDEIQKDYPIDEHIYAVQFIETDFESETITCDGVIVDKENGTIRLKTNSRKKKHDTFESVAGYITYAVFPEEELAGCDFSKQPYVHYPVKRIETFFSQKEDDVELKIDVDADEILSNQKIIFIKRELCYSEGYENHGYFVDNKGYRHFYDLSEMAPMEDALEEYKYLLEHFDDYPKEEFWTEGELKAGIQLLYNVDENAEMISDGNVAKAGAATHKLFGIKMENGNPRLIVLINDGVEKYVLYDVYVKKILEQFGSNWKYF